MTETKEAAATRRPGRDVRARSVAGGRLVTVRAGDLPDPLGLPDDTEVLCLKAIRRGKGFLNHYLVPLEPLPGARDGMMLIYVDTDLALRDVSEVTALRCTVIEGAESADVGDVVENPNGRFLKVRESYKDAFSLGYVELDSGEIKRRQDAKGTGVLRWAVVHVAGSEPAPKAEKPESRPPVEPGGGVRAMTLEDVAAAALLLSARGLGITRDLSRRLKGLVDDPLSLCCVAEDDDRVVGVVVAVDNGFHAFLSQIAVDDAYEGRGVGRSLAEAVEAIALERGLRGVLADSNLASAGFFGRMGFHMAEAVLLVKDRS